jgi:hypothetical protein
MFSSAYSDDVRLGEKIAVFWVVAPCSLVEVYGATTQKTAIFILTAVRTSNPTKTWKFMFPVFCSLEVSSS